MTAPPFPSARSGTPGTPGTTDAPESEDQGRPPELVRGPALVVLGIAVLIVVVGIAVSIVDTGGPPAAVVTQVTLADKSVVQLTPATSALSSIVSDGQPPTDILANLAVPAGSTFVRMLNSDRGQSQFDRTVTFRSRLTSDQVLQAFEVYFKKTGWSRLYNGASDLAHTPGTEVLARKGSSDGYYWETGVVVSPTLPSGSTIFSVELFEQPEAD